MQLKKPGKKQCLKYVNCEIREISPEMYAVTKLEKNSSKLSNLPSWLCFDVFDENSTQLSIPPNWFSFEEFN